jgi:hypothetical protein
LVRAQRRHHARALCLASALGLCVSPHRARAQPPPVSLTGRYSPYEVAAIRGAEQALGARVAAAPEGKLVERIDLVVLDPIEPRDPLPTAFNVLHVRTRDYVITRELLLRRGERYTKVLADESARNLRASPQFSLVVCVAMSGTAPDRVRLVVITKDVWSLMLDFDFHADNKGVSRLLLEPQESNLFGTHHAVFARIGYDPATWSLGADYRVPRVDGRWLTLVLDANAVVNRTSGGVEGSFGAIQVVRPFRSSRSPWSWFASFDWRSEVSRKFFGSELRTFTTPGGAELPYEWRSDSARGVAAVTRSAGWRDKHDFTLGLSATREHYRLPSATLGAGPPAVAAFRDAAGVPASNGRAGPFLQWHEYTSDFLRSYELETLGFQEDFRLGHNVLLGAAPGVLWLPASGPELGERHAVVDLDATFQETLPLLNGFVRAAVEGSADWDFGLATLEDRRVSLRLRVVTPRLGFGRFVEDARVSARSHNRLRQTDAFGGDDRLRGYAPGYLVGPSDAALNLEYRTPALALATEQVGAVVFYDAAAVGPKPSQLFEESAVGFGIRVVTPLIERAGLRIDVGFPIHPRRVPGSSEPFGPLVSATFGQAFPVADVPTVAPPPVE